ncbi:MAG: hypothetical protein HGGPFJEG_00982 [Ignavibacteria bacterium]|nr:hypothetical protein [Ignavibacteria bacterium]
MDSYFTIDKNVFSEIKIIKSVFIAGAFPFKLQTEIPDILKNIKKKYHDASHHPYAFRAGLNKNNFRTSDDGEPSGTSGKPILEAIDKYNLTDLIVIVTRYFGGIKLGIGGLRRAYFDAADECLLKAEIIEKFITNRFAVKFDYKFMNVIMRLLENKKAAVRENLSAEQCCLNIEVRISESENLKSEIVKLTNGSAVIT